MREVKKKILLVKLHDGDSQCELVSCRSTNAQSKHKAPQREHNMSQR